MDIPPFKRYSQYFFILFLLVILLLSIFLILPYLTTLLTSMILAYLVYPLYLRLNSKLKNETVTAFILLLAVIFIVIIPLFFVINSLVNESLSLYSTALASDIKVNDYLAQGIDRGLQFIVSTASQYIISVPAKLLNIFVFFFTFFYFLKDGKRMLEKIKGLLPLEKNQKDKLATELKTVISAILYGLVLTGIIEGIIGALGFYIFDLPSPILWGMVMLIFTILPGVGTSLVWAPAGIIKIILGDTFNGIGILLYGLLIISSIELILKPKFIGRKTNLHPIIILLGVLGGLSFMGFSGILFGPIILATLLTLIKFIGIKKN